MQRRDAFMDRWFSEGATPPIAFRHGGKPFAELAKDWNPRRERRVVPDVGEAITLAWTGYGLAVRCEALVYGQYPVVEWSATLEGLPILGGPPIPRVEDLLAADVDIVFPNCHLHHQMGDAAEQPNSLEPHPPRLLTVGDTVRLGPHGGRPCSRQGFPYFMVEGGDAASWNTILLALGWPGQWSASFAGLPPGDRPGERGPIAGFRFTAGQETTRFELRPGEKAITPTVAACFATGDGPRATRVWRRWMMAHVLPKVDGQLPPPGLYATSCGLLSEMLGANTANQKEFLDRYEAAGVLPDYWWMDAGWYELSDAPCYAGPGGWTYTGTWKVDRKRFPGGLGEISAHARAKGMKTILWFEPERVMPGTELARERHDWLLFWGGPGARPPADAGDELAGNGMQVLDFGNPEARRWITERVLSLLESEGIDFYREDSNFDPLPFWTAHDMPGREGLTENFYHQGHLAFWDELLRRRPGLRIDTCASGGRRNDLLSLRRAVPLHRTDYNYSDQPMKQNITREMARWIPYWGVNMVPEIPDRQVDAYAFRSGMGPVTVVGPDVRRADVDTRLLARLVAERRKVAPMFLGDYRPLAGYAMGQMGLAGWQFTRPDLGQALVQLFRRTHCPVTFLRVSLGDLDPGARYLVEDFDATAAGTAPVRMDGKTLMEDGLPVSFAGPREAKVFWIREADRE